MGPKRRLLIVDDSQLIREMVSDFFRPWGYRVDEAENGEAGLERLDREIPDVIVADILMPGIDGWKFFDAVRERPDAADVPFLFLTTQNELPHRLRGLSLGADDYIVKPFAIEELHARVERILQRREKISARLDEPGELLLSGSVEHLPIADLLQILSLNGKDAIVCLTQDGAEGRIVFEGGAIVHAEAGSPRGAKALFRMLGWERAIFRVLPLDPAATDRTLELSTADALMDGMVAVDEWNRWREALPDADQRLEFVDGARSKLKGRKVSSAEFDVMRRSKKGSTISDILEGSDLPDGELAHAICDLLDQGVLRAGTR